MKYSWHFTVYARSVGMSIVWLLSSLLLPVYAQSDAFTEWLAELRAEALTLGIRAETLDKAWREMRFQPLVIELDRKQPESTLTYTQYVERVLPEARIQRGNRLLRKHQTVLQDISKTSGVPARFIIALWGVESDFGRVTGSFSVLSSLATLAYEGRRGAFFRQELLAALQILDEGHILPQEMRGSWAGAMGQSQFLPSSFRRFAVDHDGDGRSDIWSSLPDVFASIANYLARSGWNRDETWGREVTLPAGFDMTLSDLQIIKPLSEWQTLGVRRAQGGDLPEASLQASVILPGRDEGPAFLVYNNYRVLMTWNRSHYFATTVGRFADRLTE